LTDPSRYTNGRAYVRICFKCQLQALSRALQSSKPHVRICFDHVQLQAHSPALCKAADLVLKRSCPQTAILLICSFARLLFCSLICQWPRQDQSADPLTQTPLTRPFSLQPVKANNASRNLPCLETSLFAGQNLSRNLPASLNGAYILWLQGNPRPVLLLSASSAGVHRDGPSGGARTLLYNIGEHAIDRGTTHAHTHTCAHAHTLTHTRTRTNSHTHAAVLGTRTLLHSSGEHAPEGLRTAS